MWDNPRLLNTAANALIGVAALLFAYAGLQLLLRSPLFPLKEIVVRGELKNAAAAEVEIAVDGVGGNFFAADLADVLDAGSRRAAEGERQGRDQRAADMPAAVAKKQDHAQAADGRDKGRQTGENEPDAQQQHADILRKFHGRNPLSVCSAHRGGPRDRLTLCSAPGIRLSPRTAPAK